MHNAEVPWLKKSNDDSIKFEHLYKNLYVIQSLDNKNKKTLKKLLKFLYDPVPRILSLEPIDANYVSLKIIQTKLTAI